MIITCLPITHRGHPRCRSAPAHPATGTTHAGTALVLGSIPATSTNLSGRALARSTPPHQALGAFVSSPSDQRQAGNHNGKTVSPFVMDYRNLMKKTAGGTPSFIFLRAIRLRVKRGAPEHRDSGALTGSPALTPWP